MIVMISLLALKNFIAEKKLVNLSLILEAFGTQREETLAMLAFLVHKGCVKKSVKTPDCVTRCLGCTPESFALYQWVEQPSPSAASS